MNNTIRVSVDINTAERLVQNEVIQGSITGEMLDRHMIHSGSGTCVCMVFEKHYYRVGNRLTLTVVIDDFEGATRVHYVSGGGSTNALFNFDWGASDKFSRVVEQALGSYRI